MHQVLALGPTTSQGGIFLLRMKIKNSVFQEDVLDSEVISVGGSTIQDIDLDQQHQRSVSTTFAQESGVKRIPRPERKYYLKQEIMDGKKYDFFCSFSTI